jgi:ABC-type glycerol-3-phosphate transport system substrate-binding protein
VHVQPPYELLEKLNRGLITRREYLKRLAALGLATPMVMAALEGRASAQETPKIAPEFPSQDEINSKAIAFRGWAYEPTTVEDNVRIFEEQYSENVDYITVTGDYGVIIDTMQINNEPLDMFYSNESGIPRYIAQGKLLDYESWWDIDRAKGEMYPAFRDAWTWKDGKLYGLPYYTAVRGTMMINKTLASKAGIETLQLTTWDDFYNLCIQLKQDGVAEYPLLHHWFAEFWSTPWQFLWECQNRGIQLFVPEEDYRPLFDENHESVKVLETWQNLFKAGVHPESAFNLKEGDYIDAFASGQYIFSPQQTYEARRFNDPSRSQIAGQVDWATPPVGQPWGKFEMGGYLLPKRDRDDKQLARVFRHNGFYGYRDINDQLLVAKRWAIEQALGSGYPAILEDPEVLAAYQSWMPGGERQFNDMKTYFDQVQWDPFYHCPWFNEFLQLAKGELDPTILGRQSPKDAISNMRSASDELYERFKGRV